MTQTTIYSLLDIDKPIDTEIVVYVKEGKELPKNTLDRLNTQSIVASKTFCPLTVKYHLDFDEADYVLPLFEKEVICRQPKEIQEAYNKVIHGFSLKAEDWFVMSKEKFNTFVPWMFPIKNDVIDAIEQHNRCQYDTKIMLSIMTLILNLYLSQD